jgi:ParB family transcriptional regulator, chromosome partitioning protein
VRRAWVRDFLQRKTAPTGAMAFITTELLHGAPHLRQALDRTHPQAADLFGLALQTNATGYSGYGKRETLAPLTDGASDKRLVVITLGLVLAANKDNLIRQSWRSDNGCEAKQYL